VEPLVETLHPSRTKSVFPAHRELSFPAKKGRKNYVARIIQIISHASGRSCSSVGRQVDAMRNCRYYRRNAR